MIISRFKIPGRTEAEDQPDLSAMDRRVTRAFITRNRVIMAVVGVLISGALLYGYMRFGLASAVTVDAERLTVATVQRAVFHDYIPVTGNVVPRTTVYLDAVAGGQVANIMVEEGALVTAGQPLLTLTNANLQLDVMGREAALAQQLYQLTTISQSLDDRRLQRERDLTEIDYQTRLLSAQLDRKRPLLAGGFVSRTEIDELERSFARYRRMHETVSAAQAADDISRPQQAAQLKDSIALITHNLAMTRQNLDALTVKAPVTGQLTLLDAEVGEAKAPGQRIGQIDSDNGFKVRANIDEFYLARVAAGQSATADIDGQSYSLEVAKIYPGVKDRQFAVDLKFGESAPAVRRGQTLHLKLEIGEANESLVIANGAFYDDTGGQWVFVLPPSGSMAVRRAVTLGRRNPDNIEILKGLETGERVIVSTTAPYLKFDRINIRGLTSEGVSQP